MLWNSLKISMVHGNLLMLMYYIEKINASYSDLKLLDIPLYKIDERKFYEILLKSLIF